MDEQKELERIILGKILFQDSRELQIDSMMKLSNDDFTNPIFKEIYSAIGIILINEKSKVNTLNLYAYLKKYPGEISNLNYGISTDANILSDIKELKASTYHRKLIKIMEGNSVRLKEAYFLDDIENVKNLTIADLSGIDFEKESNFIDFDELDKQLIHNVTNEKKNKIDGYSWGLKDLDVFTNGILLSKFYVIGALKKAGKTRFIIHCLRELYNQNITSAFLSLEVPQYDFYKLFKASFLGIEDTVLRSGSLKFLDYNTQKKLMEIKFNPSLLMIECNNSLMIGEVLGRIKRYSKLGAKVVFLDFMQRIRYDIKNSVNELESISKQLADITRELNIALVLLCQLNNLAERDVPSISHLKGSGGMAEAADTIFIFDNIYRRTGNEKEKNIIDVEISQRYGESGKIKMYADLGKCKFADYTFSDIEKIPKSYDGVLKSFHEQPELNNF